MLEKIPAHEKKSVEGCNRTIAGEKVERLLYKHSSFLNKRLVKKGEINEWLLVNEGSN